MKGLKFCSPCFDILEFLLEKSNYTLHFPTKQNKHKGIVFQTMSTIPEKLLEKKVKKKWDIYPKLLFKLYSKLKFIFSNIFKVSKIAFMPLVFEIGWY